VSLDPQLVEILACPDEHHTPLDYDPAAETLTCPECQRVYEVRDGIPVLLLDEARVAGDGPAPAENGRAGDGPARAGDGA
jgi:uncharacterized protein YbaR (Trm112 family)